MNQQRCEKMCSVVCVFRTPTDRGRIQVYKDVTIPRWHDAVVSHHWQYLSRCEWLHGRKSPSLQTTLLWDLPSEFWQTCCEREGLLPEVLLYHCLVSAKPSFQHVSAMEEVQFSILWKHVHVINWIWIFLLHKMNPTNKWNICIKK